MDFYPMSKLPDKAKDLSGNELDVSVNVLVYEIDFEKNELLDFDTGFYSFEDNLWYVLGDFAMHLNCWTYIPLPDIKNMNIQDYPIATHHGYNS